MNEINRAADPAYDDAKRIARDGDSKARESLAARADVAPEILYFLAEDDDAGVRRAIARNEATPVQADLLLSDDGDEAVREGLAGKIGRTAADTIAATSDKTRAAAVEVVARLARDELPRVREVLAASLAEVTGSPPAEIVEAIKTLAADTVLAVAAPVLERSVVLSETDLLDIVESGTADGGLACIARRAGLGEPLAEAIADDGDVDAVAALLSNASAQIREETLDRLVDQAAAVEAWHEPLVRRSALPNRSALKIASFVADSLLDVLTARDDLDRKTAKAVAKVAKQRLAAAQKDAKAKARAEAKAAGETPADRAMRMKKDGTLNGDAVTDAIDANDREFAAAGLALLAGLKLSVVADLLAARNAKAATALAWKAGLSMRQAMQVQTKLARVAPNTVLYARGGTDYPMSEADMEWQIEFFGRS